MSTTHSTALAAANKRDAVVAATATVALGLLPNLAGYSYSAFAFAVSCAIATLLACTARRSDGYWAMFLGCYSALIGLGIAALAASRFSIDGTYEWPILAAGVVIAGYSAWLGYGGMRIVEARQQALRAAARQEWIRSQEPAWAKSEREVWLASEQRTRARRKELARRCTDLTDEQIDAIHADNIARFTALFVTRDGNDGERR